MTNFTNQANNSSEAKLFIRSKPPPGGSRNSCSGVDVYDPDLQRRIKVCEPVSNYFGGGMLCVTKRSNAAGITIINAILKD
ncbi:hypothetical protein CRM79_01990 [Pantoea agglomerans]|nr:hypothetical protein [Pantoea agglomerans]PEI06039.1 hypothetical protein CRM79_01990 [Pantoea agglomerans]